MSVEEFAASGLVFRDATSADARELNELYNSIIEERTSIEWDEVRPIAEHRRYLERMIQTEYPCVLAHDGDLLVAFGAFERWDVNADGLISFFTARLSICVRSAYRRAGIASHLWHQLVNHPLTKKKQLYNILCPILTCNGPAIHALKSLNFTYGGQLTDIAIKKERRTSLAIFSRAIGAQPSSECIKTVGFPSFDLPVQKRLNFAIVPSKVVVRDATLKDVNFMTSLYDEQVHSSSAVDFYEEQSEAEKAGWLSELIATGWTCLIAEQDDVPLGYMSITSYGDEGQCYRNTGYISAFMHSMARKQGIAEILFRHLLDHPVMVRHQIRYLIGIHASNGAALTAALKAGFTHAVTVEQTSVKFGEWIADTWWYKKLPTSNAH